MRKVIRYLVIATCIIVVLLMTYSCLFAPGFSMSGLNSNNIYRHIEYLSSPELEGRMVGTIENEKALDYIQTSFKKNGIKPGNDNSYLQSFEMIVPNIDNSSIFTVNDESEQKNQSFKMYKDYSVITSYQGGSVDYKGEILLVGSNLLRIPKEEIQNKIVVIVSATLNPERIQYVADHGGLGIFCSVDTENFYRDRKLELQKNISMEGKTGESLVVGYVSKDMYNTLIESSIDYDEQYIVGRVKSARIKVDIDFSIVETSNFIAKLEGTDKNGRVLILSSNIDGLGKGTDGQYFPGALNSTSGISSLIEIGQVLKEQKITAKDTIVFIGFNGQQQDYAGSSYYLNNPIYPLELTTLIHIESIGAKSFEGLKVSSDYFNSNFLKSKFIQYGFDQSISLSIERHTNSILYGFIDESVPCINLNDGNKWMNSYSDNINNVNINALENGTKGILSFLQREIYKSNKIDFLNQREIVLIILLILVILINSGTHYLNKRYGNKKFLNISYEEIYYSLPIRVIRSFSKRVFPYIVIVFMIVVLANLSSQTNIKKINGEWVTNFSPYLLFKKTIFYLRNMFNIEMHNSYSIGNIFDIIRDTSIKSLKLIISALILSIIFGIGKGLVDGMRVKKNKVNSLGTLVVFSLPDVLIVLVSLLFYVHVAVNFPLFNEKIQIQKFLLPLISLTIIPSIYISRIAFITTQAELDKDYIKHARAIGMSKFRVFATELFPAVLFTIVDTLPAIMAMLFTNMIIVEYMFNYNGISYYLLYLYNRNDAYRFVPLALTLGLIYILFTYGISWIAKLINPKKRELKYK